MHLFDDFLKFLGVVVTLTGFVEFAMGKARRDTIKSKLRSIWIFLQDIDPSRFGREEAISCCAAMDKMLGKRFFTRRRLWFSLVLYATEIVALYLIVEIRRAFLGLSWRPPLSSAHWATGFPYQLPVIFVSLYVTQLLTRLSLRLASGKKFSVVRFATSLICISATTYFLLVGILGSSLSIGMSLRLADLIPHIIGNRPIIVFSSEDSKPSEEISDRSAMLAYFFGTVVGSIGGQLTFFYSEIGHATRDYMDWIALRLIEPAEAVLRFVLDRPSHERINGVESRESPRVLSINGYSAFVDLATSMVRVVFAIGFLVAWILVKPAHTKTIQLIEFLDESEKGIFTVIAALTAIIVKALQLLIQLR